MSADEDVMLFLSVERVQNPAHGRHGGQPGAAGRIRLGDGADLSGKGEYRIAAGETLIFETPGGGGFRPAPGTRPEPGPRRSGRRSDHPGCSPEDPMGITHDPTAAARRAIVALRAGRHVGSGRKGPDLALSERKPAPAKSPCSSGSSSGRPVIGRYTRTRTGPTFGGLWRRVHDIPAEQILCGNGSLDLIGCLARVYLGESRAALDAGACLSVLPNCNADGQCTLRHGS